MSVFAYLGDNGYEPGVLEGVPNDTQVVFTRDCRTLTRRGSPSDLSHLSKPRQVCRLRLFENLDLTLDSIDCKSIDSAWGGQPNDFLW